MALFCRKSMTPLQRSSMRWMGVALLLTIVANILTVGGPDPLRDTFPFLRGWSFLTFLNIGPGNAPVWKLITVVAVTLLPVLLAVFVGARYLAEEPDEFIRALVMRAVLWGIAWTLAADAIAGVWMAASGRTLPIALLNGDVLFIATMLSFRLAARRFSR